MTSNQQQPPNPWMAIGWIILIILVICIVLMLGTCGACFVLGAQ